MLEIAAKGYEMTRYEEHQSNERSGSLLYLKEKLSALEHDLYGNGNPGFIKDVQVALYEAQKKITQMEAVITFLKWSVPIMITLLLGIASLLVSMFIYFSHPQNKTSLTGSIDNYVVATESGIRDTSR